MKAPVLFTGFQQTTKSLQQEHCATIRTFWTCVDSPFYAFIVNSPLTTLIVYDPFQKEMDKKDGASTNWLRVIKERDFWN